jgi:hypothetical protein
MSNACAIILCVLGAYACTHVRTCTRSLLKKEVREEVTVSSSKHSTLLSDAKYISGSSPSPVSLSFLL